MAITSIKRDMVGDPAIVRIETTDTLSAITTAEYLTTQKEEIRAFQHGDFEWLEGDIVLINYSNGEGMFTHDAVNNTFDAETIPGSLSSTLSNMQMFVGNASNEATGVALSGDATISNTGVLTVGAAAIGASKLAVAVRPSHVVKFAGLETTVGGDLVESITVTGALSTDLVFIQIFGVGNGAVCTEAKVTANTLTTNWSIDPVATVEYMYQIIRAIA